MSNKHVKHIASVHEHITGSAPKDKKILGFGMNTIVLLAVLILGTAIVATLAGFAAGTTNAVSASAVDKTVLMSTVENYVNTNLLSDPAISAKIIDANEVGNGLYALSFEIYQNNAKVSAGTLYANKDKVLIGQAFDLNTPLPKAETPAESTEAQVVKSDKPVVDLYVMSFCPYGNKAEDTMKPVFDLLANKVTFNVHYIVNVSGTNVQSLHGAAEVTEDKVEACVLKNYDLNKWFELATYVNTNCGSNGSCWEAGATTLGIDTTKINDCVASEGVALMQANADASNAANANGSPTMLVNGVSTSAVYQYGNSEAYKQAICAAFNTAPSECETVLSGSTSTAAGGSC